MGMTIEERIAELVRVKHYAAPRHYETLDVAIETMRKYQKIQEIVNNAKDSDGAVKYNWLYEHIREVVEDGNDN